MPPKTTLLFVLLGIFSAFVSAKATEYKKEGTKQDDKLLDLSLAIPKQTTLRGPAVRKTIPTRKCLGTGFFKVGIKRGKGGRHTGLKVTDKYVPAETNMGYPWDLTWLKFTLYEPSVFDSEIGIETLSMAIKPGRYASA
ncbi:hypothetical protein COCMIDRAFT_29759 [Bipolaris oryzae ATCC 44560]|uniref:Uncharacterized protein n=1 Tax=Bipolaris oryzae ATCC 44560 TaxID=930090 RepID=W6YV99_COCMI|nr:uncharacterized protein COCMIDRAFT_29759 [Bipolaris oryzae ATCC 44560]EUC41473.1 hypothetical protein COCMIDRAFT_29759 [Bipolaris oryzae ATCC 44560]